MKHLLNLFLTPHQPANQQVQAPILNWLAWALLIVALIGFADASFIAYEQFQGKIPPCSVLNGCESVLTSKYSSLGPIKIEWIGIAYYLLIFILIVAYLDSGKISLILLAARLTAIGLLVSIGLVFLQVFVIKSLCLYCLISAATSTTLFILGLIILSKNARHNP